MALRIRCWNFLAPAGDHCQNPLARHVLPEQHGLPERHGLPELARRGLPELPRRGLPELAFRLLLSPPLGTATPRSLRCHLFPNGYASPW